VLAALIFDKQWGGAIAAEITAESFDDPYRQVAENVLAYWAQYKKAPGPVHLDDLMFEQLAKDKNSRVVRLLRGLAAVGAEVNGEFVADRVGEFRSQQSLGSTLEQAGERYMAGGPGMAGDVAGIMSSGLKEVAREGRGGGQLLELPSGMLSWPTLGETPSDTAISRSSRGVNQLRQP
jgi:hypothetical protein